MKRKDTVITVNKQNLNAATISAILDEIHDRWFDIGQVSYAESTGCLRIPFGEDRRGPFNRLLTIDGVAGYEVRDEAGIGLYDLNSISIQPSTREVVVTSAFPLEIRVQLLEDWEITIDECL